MLIIVRKPEKLDSDNVSSHRDRLKLLVDPSFYLIMTCCVESAKDETNTQVTLSDIKEQWGDK